MGTTDNDLTVTLREIDRQEAVIANLETELDRARTFAVGAALALAAVGALVMGFYFGRTTAPKPEPQPQPVASASPMTLGDLGGTSPAATKAAEEAVKGALGRTKLQLRANPKTYIDNRIAEIAEEWGEHQRLVQQHPAERRPRTAPFPGGLSERTFEARCFAAGGEVLWTNPLSCTVDIPALMLPAIPR
ncbi:hypothetical protein KIH27_15900 [Mycobacterium sp. M1]|uniref:Uncharacterized protein n=1 Tax=Mycolicibacter acidiphilus TaxID=2835306 RepID=A0ABS5RNL1_9MYCO|nr:hypothetical protein [Mycolicibacter acidiphilus]MBS9535071.1 hypothetical protein [Mycolicibacter acidiphilus]